MKTWYCSECETEFVSGCSKACLKCGSTDIACLNENASINHSGASTEDKIRDILQRLCLEVYEASYKGVEWEESISSAFEKLKPYFKDDKILV